MMSGALGEIIACIVRVPTENIKQNLQITRFSSPLLAIKGIYQSRGLMGFYTGYGTTIMREIPFSIIQFPIWEKFKVVIANYQKRPCSSFESAIGGSFSGAIAAAIT